MCQKQTEFLFHFSLLHGVAAVATQQLLSNKTIKISLSVAAAAVAGGMSSGDFTIGGHICIEHERIKTCEVLCAQSSLAGRLIRL